MNQMFKKNKASVYLFDLREKGGQNLKEAREQSEPRDFSPSTPEQATWSGLAGHLLRPRQVR